MASDPAAVLVQSLVHTALAPGDGAALEEARWTDRQRLAAVLQGAALLAHLEHAGWHAPAGFAEARGTADGRLVVPGCRPGRSREPAQEALKALLARLFGAGEIAGRGEARRAARALLDRWRADLAPAPPDEAVGRVLAAAPFLWEEDCTGARRALAAEHRRPDGARLWVAGPGRFRARLLARCRDLAALADLLASAEARAAWEGEEGADPLALATARRWAAAVAAWGRRPPATVAERLELARSLAALGRFERALEALADARPAPARALKAWCQLQLGRLGAARATLRRLEGLDLTAAEVVEAAEVAARALANAGEPHRATTWVERALAAARGPLRARAELLAALAAWDREDLPAMDRHLAAARPLVADAALAWRWHHAQALRAMTAGEGPAVVAAVSLALAGRRALTRTEAAALWNDLGFGRVQAGDLAGAERAFLHAARLLDACDGPRKTTLVLHNLAEVRLRRGRLAGVREILERSAAENRLAGNRRGLAHDHELWARLELAEGKPAAALALCRGTEADLDRYGVSWRREGLAALAARALGWLGRREEAAAELARAGAEAVAAFEPEERPALWAHAGRRSEALAAVDGTPAGPLWRAALSGAEPPAEAWDALAGLEPYRAARLALDLELAAPGSVPADRRRRAAAALVEAGAGRLAERLEGRDAVAWRALSAYAEADRGAPEAVARLFAEAGYAAAELTWVIGDERRPLARSRGAGTQAGVEVEAPLGGDPGDPRYGRLVLRAPEVDAPLSALFALVRRDLGDRIGPSGDVGPPLRAAGIVGESPALAAALERVARLAPADLPVLVLGESGTGKELVAREIHRRSRRGRAPFLAVNCAAVSESLLLSDLFGHVRGSFTGAERDRAGVFEAAQGGTVLLDEIGDLPLAAQGMLLRVLQEGEVRRVGESLPRRVDVRVVAATHRDLARLVREGTFREDLFYRLRVAAVELPPLRERGRDVLLLAEHLLARTGEGGRPAALSAAARARLLAHPWPGNVRELGNVLAVAAALAGDGPILPEHLDLPAPEPASVGTAGSDYHRQVDALRRRLVEEAMADAGGNRTEAARRLGLSRQGFSYLLRQLRLV